MIKVIENKNELGDTIGIIVSQQKTVIRDFSSVRGFIFWLFRFRCIGLDEPCHKQATDLSHIVPKSRGKISEDWHYLVTHCPECHAEYHKRGISDEAIQNLQERRIEYLEAIGREDYI